MGSSQDLIRALLALLVLAALAVGALAQQCQPTQIPPPACPAAMPGCDSASQECRSSEQLGGGSVLVYNLYSSNAAMPAAEDTMITITNNNSTCQVAAHFFFVDGSTCAVADAFICLRPSQTFTFFARDIDPGVMGYIVVVASWPLPDSFSGCPVNFNFLTGTAMVRLASGHTAFLSAVQFRANYGNTLTFLPTCLPGDTSAVIRFNCCEYDRAPCTLTGTIPSPVNNQTLLVINRIGGDLRTSADPIGAIFGLLFDSAGRGLSFAFSGGCQIKRVVSNSFPRTTRPVSQVIPAGAMSTIRFSTASLGTPCNPGGVRGITGAVLTLPFSSGLNFTPLAYTRDDCFIIPIFPVMCPMLTR